jgi:hypothetical protein
MLTISSSRLFLLAEFVSLFSWLSYGMHAWLAFASSLIWDLKMNVGKGNLVF